MSVVFENYDKLKETVTAYLINGLAAEEFHKGIQKLVKSYNKCLNLYEINVED